MEPGLSVLIITYNRAEDTLALLKSLNEQVSLQENVGEILLLNNASTTDYSSVTTYIKETKSLPIKYINHSENLGVARGRNFLIGQASFPYLLVIDDDMVFPEKDAIKKLAQYFNKPFFSNKNTAIISFDVYYFDTGERQKNALPHKRFETYKDKEQFFTYYFSGGAHIVKKDIFNTVGFYPEDFFYGMEEYDLSYRIIKAGYTIGYDKEVRILHKESPQGRTATHEKLAMMWYNKCVVAWRYLPNKYFYSTAFMWSLEYLRKSGLDFYGMLRGLNRIRKIPSKIQTQKIRNASITYLKSVDARLWY